jgi:hypothetical protein
MTHPILGTERARAAAPRMPVVVPVAWIPKIWRIDERSMMFGGDVMGTVQVSSVVRLILMMGSRAGRRSAA